MSKSLLRLLLFAPLLLAGCRPLSLYMDGPTGPPEYKLGWEDGCDTGLSAEGGLVGKATFGFKKRAELGDNDLYKTAWNEGFSYCRFSLDPVNKNTWFN
ncbi:MAG: hypothetical protein ACKVOE_05930 [Rickettsiales bacterium]